MAGPFRVRGYPYLETERPQGGPAQLEAGRIDVRDVQPALLRGLEWVGERLQRPLVIFSGYRTSAYSEHVGGFAGDPHSRGIAADVNLNGQPIGSVPRARRLLAQAGLVSGAQPGFYHGKPDPAHVQLGSGASAGASSATSLGQLWIEAGGPPKLANIMAAIALAESGGRLDAKGGPNDDGSYDYGLWQINSSHRAYDANRLLSDPLYNARAAVAIERTQGLTAWTTYRDGDYRQYLPGASGALPTGTPRSRPGGEPAGGGDSTDEAQLASWKSWLDNPGTDPLWLEHQAFGWNPLSIFSDAAGAVKDVGSFLKWIAWLFHPRNLLRLVEFFAGLGLLLLGVWIEVKGFSEAREQAVSKTGIVRRAARKTSAGRALDLRRARREGRSAERFQRHTVERNRARKAGSADERTREKRRRDRREGRGPSEEIPF